LQGAARVGLEKNKRGFGPLLSQAKGRGICNGRLSLFRVLRGLQVAEGVDQGTQGAAEDAGAATVAAGRIDSVFRVGVVWLTGGEQSTGE
jgi:hypothetical protein